MLCHAHDPLRDNRPTAVVLPWQASPKLARYSSANQSRNSLIQASLFRGQRIITLLRSSRDEPGATTSWQPPSPSRSSDAVNPRHQPIVLWSAASLVQDMSRCQAQGRLGHANTSPSYD